MTRVPVSRPQSVFKRQPGLPFKEIPLRGAQGRILWKSQTTQRSKGLWERGRRKHSRTSVFPLQVSANNGGIQNPKDALFTGQVSLANSSQVNLWLLYETQGFFFSRRRITQLCTHPPAKLFQRDFYQKIPRVNTNFPMIRRLDGIHVVYTPS